MGFSPEDVERYARHLVLAEIGGPGQQKLAASTVALIGAGGVGSPAALYLAAAGVGTLRIIDPDTVSLSNLQRQVLFDTADVRRPKVEIAERRLAALNPGVRIEAVPEALTSDTATRLIAGTEVVVDGTDDFGVRHTVNAACVDTRIPLVSGALGRWSGQVGVFTGRPCYRCLVPDLPPDAETCARVGVVGALAGVIGSMAALEAIKLITGAGEPLTGRLLLYDGLSATSRTVEITADPGCPVCSTSASPARGVLEG
jgi:molybdopterin/thiamine biosynthesis adenylyltransferase